ncbi:hypothetical protein ID866_11204 [Astraeus odoratus]|nr:hypothetical protein ID866_11204 [Astraeus odoratus]
MPTQQTSAGVLLTHQNETIVTPQTPSHPRNPGNPGSDDPGNDPGNDPFNNNDNGDENNNENVDKATNVLQALGHAIENLAHNEDSSTSSGKTRSYLKGMALEWFEPNLLSSSDPEDHPFWMDDWKEFVIELQSTFSPHNLVADAENQLDHLQMKVSYP